MEFQVGPWLACPELNCVVREGRACHVTPKSMDLLVYLARRRGEVAPKAEILQEVWAGTFVSDDALTRCVGELRRAFGETPREATVLETVAKRGYRIVAPVIWSSEANDPAPAASGCRERETVIPSAEPVGGARTRRVHRLFSAMALVLLAILVTATLRRPSQSAHLGATLVPKSIAVLPLLNLSGDATQEYFADGMTELLTSTLSKLGNLRVISRTSAMTYKGSRKPLQAIARELNVDTIVEGSVTRSGLRVRIVAQLIDASNDAHLWTNTYEGEFADVLGLQARIAEAIVREIDVTVTREDSERLAFRPRIKPEAYEAYLKGMHHLNKFTPEGFEQGISYLRRAVAEDPADPFGHAALALGYSIAGHDRFPNAFPEAEAEARRSLELGGPLAEAYCALGMEELYSDWDLAAAGRDLRKALALKPSFAEARRNYSWYLRLLGRPQDGLGEMKRAVSLEPLAPLFPADLGWQYFEEGQLDDALGEARKAIELNGNFSEGLAVAGWVLAEWGRHDEALALHLKAAAADPAWKWPLGKTYAAMGRAEDARRIASELGRSPGPMELWGLAVIYAALDEKDESFRWLEAARQSRFSWMPWISDFSRRKLDLFTSLRGDSRFDQMRQRIGIPADYR
jgi:TolB-like protein/DNA-binding winged helix-turn-helix (wHTH) protein/Flp pilus assembly protein TadD